MVNPANEVDLLVKEKLIPFRERIVDAIAAKHPMLISILDAILMAKSNRIGLEVTDGGAVVGRYTLHLKGIRIAEVEFNKLDPAVHHPLLGLIRPAVSVERRTIEALLADEDRIREEPFSSIARHLPGVTIRFL